MISALPSSESENELEMVESKDEEEPPWKVKNLEGNTPLHLGTDAWQRLGGNLFGGGWS